MNKSRQFCPVDTSQDNLFFSLADYRNTYFTSNDPKKIVEFYNAFENREKLIMWMRERPRGVARIHEVEGDKGTIVVIPTADFDGKFAINCRENIFNGLHIIFVESGEIPDHYFNYAHNVNVGIRKAMEYNPKWIVVSNDDMIKVDDVSKLLSEIRGIDHRNVDCAFLQSSAKVGIATPRIPLLIGIMKSFAYHNKNIYLFLEIRKIEKKFLVKLHLFFYFGKYTFRPLFKFMFKDLKVVFTLTGAFAIFSCQFVNKNGGSLFDETYINGHEDQDLSLNLRFNNIKVLKYQIGVLGAGSLGNDITRELRMILNEVYLEEKLQNLLTKTLSD